MKLLASNFVMQENSMFLSLLQAKSEPFQLYLSVRTLLKYSSLRLTLRIISNLDAGWERFMSLFILSHQQAPASDMGGQ